MKSTIVWDISLVFKMLKLDIDCCYGFSSLWNILVEFLLIAAVVFGLDGCLRCVSLSNGDEFS